MTNTMLNIESIGLDLDSLSPARAIVCDVDDINQHIPLNKDAINIISQNIRSIQCNMDSFSTLLQRSKLTWDVIVLSECWLPSAKHIATLDSYNYATTTRHKTQNEGVVIYYRSSLKGTTEEPLLIDANCLILKLSNNTCVIGIYRPPSYHDTNSFINSLETILTSLRSFQNIILCGDINIDIHPNGSDRRAQDYLNLLASHSMLPGHTIPTHGRTCLDHVIIKTKLEATCFVLPSSITDHDSIALNIHVRHKALHNNNKRTRVDFLLLDAAVQKIDFQAVIDCTDINQATNTLIMSLSVAIKTSTVPIKCPKRNIIFKPWITKGLLRCMRNRDNLHKKLKKAPDNEVLQITYKRYRSFCSNILRNAKQAYNKQKFDKAGKDKKLLWKTIKDVTESSYSPDHSISLLTNYEPHHRINEINNFFANIGKEIAEKINCPNTDLSPTLNSSIPTPLNNSHPLGSLVIAPLAESEIARIIAKLKDKNSAGIDHISNSMVKRYADYLVAPITHICNLAFETGVFPSAFKTALIKPIYKSGDKGDVNNFRPISILPTLSKILERVMNERLTSYLERNKTLAPSQYGFRSGTSTSLAVHNLTNTIVTELDDKKKCVVAFLDITKAFDTVPIPRLLDKLERVGVRGLPLSLFRDYLSNRRQMVKIGDWVSDETEVTYGVPQGSVISPTLFLVYINDLCQIQLNEGKIYTFADDTALFFRGNTWEETFSNAQMGFDRVNEWMKGNLLSLNVAKTKYIPFAIRANQLPPQNCTIIAHTCSKLLPTVPCTCTSLERTNTIKYLGVTLDQTLTFKPHIDLLTARLRKLIYVFKTIRNITTRVIIKNIYYALCHSLIEYCITSWGGAAKTNMIVVERAQRVLLKVAAGLPYRHPTDTLYRDWDILSIRQTFILRVILMKHTETEYDPDKNEGKRRKGTVCTYQPRRTAFSQHFYCFLGDYLYNKINATHNIYHLVKYKCKQVVIQHLKKQNYENIEKSLHPLE